MFEKLRIIPIFVCCALSPMNTFAYEHSEEYYQCVSVPDLSSVGEFRCIKEENMMLLRKLEEMQQQFQSFPLFREEAQSGNTAAKQLENWQKYVNSYCQYSMEGECPDYRTPEINKEECIYGFMATLAEDWENMLKDVRKKNSFR